MSDEPIVAPVVEAPAVEPVVVPAAPVEQTYTYQPRDEENRPLGGPQVIKYKTSEELAEKLSAQNSELVRLNRKLNKDIRLGTFMRDEIPADAPRVREGQYEVQPRPLSAEERLQLVQDLADPEKCDSATDRLIESRIGSPQAILATLSEARQQIGSMNAQKEAEAFVRSTPDYFVCPDNFQTLANWMIKNDLEPVKANFMLAFKVMREAGLVVERPVVESPAVVSTPATVVEAPAAATPEATPRPAARPTSSGLTRSQASDGGVSAAKKGYTPAEIDKMSADEYKQKILVPEFKASRRK